MQQSSVPARQQADDLLAEPVDLGDDGQCSAQALRAILEEFRAEMKGLTSETHRELLEYYNMQREDKGLAPLDARILDLPEQPKSSQQGQ